MDKKTITYVSIGAVSLIVIIIVIVAITRKKKPPITQVSFDEAGNIIHTAPVDTNKQPSSIAKSFKKLFTAPVDKDTLAGKAAFAKTDNVTVYDSHNVPRKVLRKGEWAGTVIDVVGSIYRIYFSDATIGWISVAQAELK